MIMQAKYCLVFIFMLSLFLSACESEKAKPQVPISQEKISPSLLPEEDFDEEEFDEESNIAPKIVSLVLKPRRVYPGTEIIAEVEVAENEEGSVEYDFRWEKNGEDMDIFGATNLLDTSDLKKGDLISVFVTPYKEGLKGQTVKSITIMISNRLPKISPDLSFDLIDGKFVSEVKASDTDNDSLTYSIENAPAGMVIDESTGRIEWTAPEGLKDSVNIKINVSDGDNTVFQGFKLSFQKEKEKKEK